MLDTGVAEKSPRIQSLREQAVRVREEISRLHTTPAAPEPAPGNPPAAPTFTLENYGFSTWGAAGRSELNLTFTANLPRGQELDFRVVSLDRQQLSQEGKVIYVR